MDVRAASAAPLPTHRIARAYLLEVRPLPMAAALLIALLGVLWAGRPLWPPAAFLPLVVAAVFFGLMTAHFMDSYVDVVLRGDRTPGDYPLLFRDSTGLLTDKEYRSAVLGFALASATTILLVVRLIGPFPALPLLLALVLAIAYAPRLDRTFAGVTFGYPAGACAVMLGAFLAAGGGIDLRFLWLTGALFTALVGIKVRADVVDIDDDRRIGKHTVAALAGKRAAENGGYALAVVGLLMAAASPFLFAVPFAFALPPLFAAAAFGGTTRFKPLEAGLWMSHAMLAALALEVAVLALA